MRTYTRLAVITAAFSLGCVAQQQNINIERGPGPGPRMQREKTEEPPVKPEDRKRALAMLDSVEGPARGMDGATQALALTQIAKAHASTDKKKAMALLDDAFSAIRGAQFQFSDEQLKSRTQNRIQRAIVQEMIPLDEVHVEKLMDEVEPELQRAVLSQLLQHYLDRKEDDKAIAAIQRISRSNEMPYRQAATVMSRMTPEQSAELRGMFTDAMTSYDLHDDPSQLKSGGFPDLIMQFHAQLPPELTRQAVDLVLSHAKKADEKAAEQGNKPSIGLSTSDAVAQFSSLYDFALFQLEPAMRAADPQYADALLKEHREAQLFLAKYPTGLAGLRAADGDPNGRGMMMTMSGGAPVGNRGGGQRREPDGPSPLDMQRMQKIHDDAEAHPQDAMASVPTLTSSQMQKDAYLGIAGVSVKKNPSISKSALSKAMDLASKLEPEEQVRTANEAAAIYRNLGDQESAKSALEKAIELGDLVYKDDTNAEDPNQAPQWYWPSTASWRSTMEVATKLDPRWATSLLKGISDDGIRALTQLAVASEILHIAPRAVQVMKVHKNGAMMMEMNRSEN